MPSTRTDYSQDRIIYIEVQNEIIQHTDTVYVFLFKFYYCIYRISKTELIRWFSDIHESLDDVWRNITVCYDEGLLDMYVRQPTMNLTEDDLFDRLENVTDTYDYLVSYLLTSDHCDKLVIADHERNESMSLQADINKD